MRNKNTIERTVNATMDRTPICARIIRHLVLILLLGFVAGNGTEVLSQVLPNYPSNDAIYGGAGQSESFRHCLTIPMRIFGPDLKHRFFGYFVASVPLATLLSHWPLQSATTLFIAIALIILICAQEKVVRSYASHIVALVEYPQTSCDGTKMQHPRKAVRGHLQAAIKGFHAEIRIAYIMSAPKQPAPVALRDVPPESLSGRNPSARHFAGKSIGACASAIFSLSAKGQEFAPAI